MPLKKAKDGEGENKGGLSTRVLAECGTDVLQFQQSWLPSNVRRDARREA